MFIYFVFIEIIDDLVKPYINLDFFSIFNDSITKYLDNIFSIYIANNSALTLYSLIYLHFCKIFEMG